MADLVERVEAEFDNIAQVLSELPPAVEPDKLSVLEKAGLGALLHSFYNGIENVLKQIVQSLRGRLPEGPTWHRDLVTEARAGGVISEVTAKDLQRYLAFRHFFSHGYAVELDLDRFEPLVVDAPDVFSRVRQEVRKHLRGR
jgi:uncharacterized protein YutE (UPF0331/DUF86 family)